MRFPTSPLSSSREISNSSFSSFPLLPSPPFSYCSKISVSIFCLVIGSSAFLPCCRLLFFCLAHFQCFPRFSSNHLAFHARLFAWLRYDLISRRSFLNDSTKF
ncbi:hypothetical protein N7471_006635 [Penicillium samsonianum]|uniref:uncharacterized protein n=1 Tax=Penicillium samsonianum TaxID=1882272 RepID=UPI002548AA4E|nr:uncharacterized protein N7471_006635 [Penicillium samsonianum]KAJ6140149.1 hypothetical protein N7471_006635 [Penicillium samsonianum]